MADITDLDAILGADKQVKLNGEMWKLPPDLPVELYLKINRYEEDGNEADQVESLYEDVLGLFRYRQPKLKSLPITLTQLVVAIAQVYGQANASEGDEQPPARPPARRGTSGRSSRPTSRSRS